MSTNQDKQIILVTGATNGIGLDTVKYLVKASASNHIIIGARSVQRGEAVLRDISTTRPAGSLSVVQLDADSDDSIAAAVTLLSADFPHLDVLINNAGICPEGPEDQWPTREQLRATFETNVYGPTILTSQLVPLLKKSTHPRIINVSSGMGSIAMMSDHNGAFVGAKYPGYRMSKSALNMLTAYQYYHLKSEGEGFKIWTYCPGYVVTDFGRDRKAREDMGLESSETSAQGILEIVEGKRDGEVGAFIARRGARYDW
ncbi:NAD(P)-binding protein [Plenodomus tracheiphilus IPT5]|uniref:NAD(P)-binding protein n=1 Tax=Plenodomus tracheiphilus IPT5 TaxID=1408161 RepID=A0A6A7ASZ4_9PLEO|nr:NAD(P)-binding protein [Plenodomus tracheiphilus IPT5]